MPRTRAPELKHARVPDDGGLVGSERSEIGERCGHLVDGGEPFVDDRVGGCFERRERQRLRLAGHVGALDEPQTGVRDGGVQEIAIELSPDGGVAAAQLEHSRIVARVEGKPAVVRVAEQAAEVGVLDHDRAAGSDGRPHPPQQIDGTTQVLKEEPAVDEVVSRRLVPVADVANAERDVRAPLLRGRLAAQRELDLVHVHAGHVPGRTDQPGDLEGDLPAPTPEIHAPHPRPDSSSGQKLSRIRPPRSGEDPQPVVALATTTDHIPLQSPDATAARLTSAAATHSRGGPARTRSRMLSSGPRNQPSASTHQVSPACA